MRRALIVLGLGVLVVLAGRWLADEGEPLAALLAWVVLPALVGAVVRWWRGPRGVGVLSSAIAGAAVVAAASVVPLAASALGAGDLGRLAPGQLDWDVPAMLAGVGAIFGAGGGAIMGEQMRRGYT